LLNRVVRFKWRFIDLLVIDRCRVSPAEIFQNDRAAVVRKDNCVLPRDCFFVDDNLALSGIPSNTDALGCHLESIPLERSSLYHNLSEIGTCF